MESIIILLIFSATAALGQQSLPHETTVTSGRVSKLFIMFYQGRFQSEMTVQLDSNLTSISFIVLAVLFFALMIISFIKKVPAKVSFLMSVLIVVCIYLSLILSIN